MKKIGKVRRQVGGNSLLILLLEPEGKPFQFVHVEEIGSQPDLRKFVGHHDLVEGKVQSIVGVQEYAVRYIDGLDIRVSASVRKRNVLPRA
jgi:hypothetical protein